MKFESEAELWWKPLEVGDARAQGYQPRRTTHREWNRTKRDVCCTLEG